MQATVEQARIEVGVEATAYAGLMTATVLWAAAFIAGKVALVEMSPLSMASWRYVLATVLVLPFGLRAWPERERLRAVALPLGLLVLCGGIAYPWLFLSSLNETTAANASLLIALNPIGTVLFAPFIGEKLTRRRVFGTVIALSGAVIVITQGDLTRLGEISRQRGDLLALAAAGAWATFNLVSRGVVAQVSPPFVNLTVFLLGGTGLVLLADPVHVVQQGLQASATAWGAVLVSAALSSVLAGQLFLQGVQRIGISRAVVFIYCVPPLTACLSWFWLGESLTLAQAVGGAAVLTGVAIASRSVAPR